jgi:septum formation protein
MVLHNAALKADWVAQRHREAVVLGADTTVFLDGEVFHKPADIDSARAMLLRLSGRTHSVFTAVVLRGALGAAELGVESRVTFQKLDAARIDRYFTQCSPLDKAGGYGIQSGAELIVDRYTGSLTNIIGLPAEETKQMLVRAGLTPAL